MAVRHNLLRARMLIANDHVPNALKTRRSEHRECGRLFAKAREESGLTLEKCASALGITPEKLDRMEKGKILWPERMFLKACYILP